MNPADETAAKIEAPESTSAPTDFVHKLNEHAAVSDFDRTSDQHRPVEELRNLLLRISHHLDYETSERSTIYYRLLSIDAHAKKIENQTKRRALRTSVRYLVAMGIAVVGTLAWQSYGDATKQTIATRAPELGWSPEVKQTIASWVEQLGWTNLPTTPEAPAARTSAAATLQAIPAAQTANAPEAIAPKAPVIPFVDPEQLQQIMKSLTALQQTVEQLAATQDQLARQITSLQASDTELLKRVPAPPPLPPAAPARKPTPAPSSRLPASGH